MPPLCHFRSCKRSFIWELLRFSNAPINRQKKKDKRRQSGDLLIWKFEALLWRNIVLLVLWVCEVGKVFKTHQKQCHGFIVPSAPKQVYRAKPDQEDHHIQFFVTKMLKKQRQSSPKDSRKNQHQTSVFLSLSPQTNWYKNMPIIQWKLLTAHKFRCCCLQF